MVVFCLLVDSRNGAFENFCTGGCHENVVVKKQQVGG